MRLNLSLVYTVENSTLSVRSTNLTDADALAALMVEGWRFAYEGLMPAYFLANLSVQERASSLRKILESNQSANNRDTRIVLSSENPEQVLGVCSFGPDRTDASAGEIYALYVAPAVIGTGLGRVLMQDAVVQLCELGFEQVFLWVLEGNERAIQFYEKAGFSLTGETKNEQLHGVELTEQRMLRNLS